MAGGPHQLTSQPLSPHQAGKKYDVITSIEKVKTGVMAYLNPMAYMYAPPAPVLAMSLPAPLV